MFIRGKARGKRFSLLYMRPERRLYQTVFQIRQGDCVQTTPVLLMFVGTVCGNNAFRHTNWNALCVEINLVNILLCQHSYNDFEKGYP